MRNGRLTLHDDHQDIPDWKPQEKACRVERIRRRLSEGAAVYGALDGTRLVGMAILNRNPMESDRNMVNLSGLWVSKGYRGIGVGTQLVALIKDDARRLGAKYLYVSATPSENTIRFYTSVGFLPTAQADPEMYAREPDDIHMRMSL